MGWRTLYITNPAALSLEHNNLILKSDERFSLPLSDLACVVIESRQVSLTTPLIDALAQSGATLFVCDEKHLPSAQLLPFMAHSRQSAMARRQHAWSAPFKKRCWQRLVQAKCANQSVALAHHNPQSAKVIQTLLPRINSGDTLNIESQAARLYFSTFFDQFARSSRQDDIRNSALNYGYAIVRGMVARALVGSGFLPTFGLHHSSELNAFNLADDMIEPFRPFVDLLVRAMLEEDGEELPIFLDKAHKVRLLGLVTMPCRFDTLETTLPYACELAAESLVRATLQNDPRLLKSVTFV